MHQTIRRLYLLILLIVLCDAHNVIYSQENSWIRINQLGYSPQFTKIAVFVSKVSTEVLEFRIIDTVSETLIWKSKDAEPTGPYGPFKSTWRLNFTSFCRPGTYQIIVNDIRSPEFSISKEIYNNTADFLLRYMRQQRCGFNPYLNDSCHVHDGFSIYGPLPDGTHIDATGGWHDATDYLQYVTTSANATFNLLMAYRDNPFSFSDQYDESGSSGTNSIPDVCDEAQWGLDWLLKMNPESDLMYNQIADDRDHQGFRLPTEDSVSYGRDLERPVYFCSGEPQGLNKFENRSTGTASTAGKFASTFALAAQFFRGDSQTYHQKAIDAFLYGLEKPGVCQTAPCRAPYFYEEDNWSDDMELAAAELFGLTKNNKFLDHAIYFAGIEPVTPWMGADTARHYQWYPFVNLGHFETSHYLNKDNKKKIIDYYHEGIQRVWHKAKNNAFRMGIPFIWCSNNLVAAMATQCYLYRSVTGDSCYIEMEAALRDWLFGCNPWGVSMVVGLPESGITTKDPHSSFSHLYDYSVDGGLLDGPVYASIYNRQKYVQLTKADEFATFQSELAVYHDDVGDYVTNEPTMDGTASLVYYLASMQKESQRLLPDANNSVFRCEQGAIIRGDLNAKQLALVFTGHEYADGAVKINDVLARKNIKSSFFFTGDFYRNKNFTKIIESLVANGHYLGAHSDRHLLYCDWSQRDSLLITKHEFLLDLHHNYIEMARFGITREEAGFYLPPFEWYNDKISQWTSECGIQLINYSPGTYSHADYTYPSMGRRYYSSNRIIESINTYERSQDSGLNGFILLFHLGTHPDRIDKIYDNLEPLIDKIKNFGYKFVRIDQLLQN